MKVLQFITRLDLGGAQECCLDLCRELAQRGHEVHLLTGAGGEMLPDAQRIPGLQLHIWSDLLHAISPLDDLRCYRRLVAWLATERFDLIHTHSSKAGILGRRAAFSASPDTQVVHHVHGWSFNEAMPGWKRAGYAAIERWASRPGQTLLCCSRATAEQGRRHRIGLDPDRRVIYYGVARQEHLRRRDRQAIRRRLGLARDDLLYLQLGNLKPQKDPLTFAGAAVRAGKQVRRARFWIAGDGPLRQQTLSLAAPLGDRFRVLGWRRDVPDLLAAADVAVLTSRFEGLPLAIIRAMASGLPMIASAVDGTPEAIRHERNGLLVDRGDVDGFASAMVRLGREPLTRRRLGVAARGDSAAFGDRRSVTEILALYEELVVGARREEDLQDGGSPIRFHVG